MTCWKIRCQRKITKSKCLEILKEFQKRLLSRLTIFKLIELVLAAGGMSLHIYQPFYKTLADSSLVPGVLGTFSVVSAVLLIGHLLNFIVPTRLNAMFSIVASLGYAWSMSSIMDSVMHAEDTKSWTYLLAKGIVCFAALAVHLLELLYAFVTRDKRPSTLRPNMRDSTPPTVSRSPSLVQIPISAGV